ncbi:MAG: flavin reductase [Oscillospiraceae bacterium]|nr:flavin reductase [Oscillospiraceae bacterium]
MDHLAKIELAQSGDFGRVIDRIGSDWMLITAGTPEQLGTMTASWGSTGVLWHRPMVNIFVRPERHTYGFVEAEDRFSIAFFNPSYREALTFCGKHSGRDVDKVAHCGFTVAEGEGGGVFFREADLVLICEKRYRSPLTFDQMMNFDPNLYYNEKKGGLHVLYMGEIVEVYAR